MSSMDKAKSGNDPLAHQGGESSANPQDPNKSKTASSEEDNLTKTNNKAEEDCEECWLRRYLKGGECKDSFTEVDNCVDDEECRDARMKLTTCMYANIDYYGTYLVQQKAALTQMLEHALKEMETAEEAVAAAAAAKKKEADETTGK